jgi:hypothetical protein
MKKLLLIVLTFVSVSAGAQINTRLDTVYTRYLVFTYEEISYLKGGWHPADSLQKVFFKKMQTAVNAVPNKVNSTNITIDSIPGQIALTFYMNFRGSTEGSTAQFTNNIKTKIKGYAPLTTTCQSVDDNFDKIGKAQVKSGKEDW